MSEVIQVGDIRVSVIRAAQRKTIGLTVERDGSVTARTPPVLPLDSVLALIKKRELWIHSAAAKRNRVASEVVLNLL